MVSGSTALTVALVPTATNAGVWMSPCGVWMTPVRPRRPGKVAPTVKKSPTSGIQPDAEAATDLRWSRSPAGPANRVRRPPRPAAAAGSPGGDCRPSPSTPRPRRRRRRSNCVAGRHHWQRRTAGRPRPCVLPHTIGATMPPVSLPLPSSSKWLQMTCSNAQRPGDRRGVNRHRRRTQHHGVPAQS